MGKKVFTMDDFEEGLRLLGMLKKPVERPNELVELMSISRHMLNLKDNRYNLRKFPRWRNQMHYYIHWAKKEAY